MLNIVKKELFEAIRSRKALAAFCIALATISLAVAYGLEAYLDGRKRANDCEDYFMERAEREPDYSSILFSGVEVARFPQKISVIHKAADDSIVDTARINFYSPNEPGISETEKNPVLFVFGWFDVTFVVGFILSLPAMFFGYNLICGEKDAGTLRKVMSFPVKRRDLVLGKIISGYFLIIITLILPLIILIIVLGIYTDIGFTVQDYAGLALIISAYYFYLAVMFNISVFISAITRKSFLSMLACILVWALTVVIVPEVAATVADYTHPVMPVGEYNTNVKKFYRENQQEKPFLIQDYFRKNRVKEENYRTVFREILMNMEELQAEKRADFLQRINGELRRKRKLNYKYSMIYSTLSPYSLMCRLVDVLSASDSNSFERFEDRLDAYRQILEEYLQKKSKMHDATSNATSRSYRIKRDEGGKLMVELPKDDGKRLLPLADMPRFNSGQTNAVGDGSVDIGLSIVSLIFFLITGIAPVLAFNRYDVR